MNLQSITPVRNESPAARSLRPFHKRAAHNTPVYLKSAARVSVAWVVVAWVVFLCGFSGSVQAQTEPSSSPSKSNRIIDFARDIAPILHEKCNSCHQGEKARNGFVIADRSAVLGLIEAGNANGSSLWTDYLIQPPKTQDKESLIMPPDGPLPAEQLASLKLWIDEGADWPEGVQVGAREMKSYEPVDAPKSMAAKAFRAIGYFHPAMVHFPIAFFFLSGACAALSYFLGVKCQSAAFQCLVLGTLTSVITVVMGWSFAEIQDYPAWGTMLGPNASHDQTNFFYHRWLGTIVPVLGSFSVLVALLARRNKSKGLNHLWRCSAIGMAALVGLVGHQGGELIYGDIFDKAIEQFSK